MKKSMGTAASTNPLRQYVGQVLRHGQTPPPVLRHSLIAFGVVLRKILRAKRASGLSFHACLREPIACSIAFQGGFGRAATSGAVTPATIATVSKTVIHLVIRVEFLLIKDAVAP